MNSKNSDRRIECQMPKRVENSPLNNCYVRVYISICSSIVVDDDVVSVRCLFWICCACLHESTSGWIWWCEYMGTHMHSILWYFFFFYLVRLSNDVALIFRSKVISKVACIISTRIWKFDDANGHVKKKSIRRNDRHTFSPDIIVFFFVSRHFKQWIGNSLYTLRPSLLILQQNSIFWFWSESIKCVLQFWSWLYVVRITIRWDRPPASPVVSHKIDEFNAAIEEIVTLTAIPLTQPNERNNN